MPKVIAVLCSDIHLSHRPPPARANEPNWYVAMQRPLDEIKMLAEQNDCVVICAGDIFDHWRSPPELINFAIKHLPKIYAVPGQHDLPHHNYSEIRKSAYWTLVEAGKIINLKPGKLTRTNPQNELALFGFPFGQPVVPLNIKPNLCSIAVAHNYCWVQGNHYPGASDNTHCQVIFKRLKGFDAAVFGDNHRGFLVTNNGTPLFNCGTLMRRRSNELQYHPHVGLLCDNGGIEPHFLDISQDVFEPVVKAAGNKLDMTAFVDELLSLQSDSLDFLEIVKRYIEDNEVNEQTRRVLLEVLNL